MSSFEQVQNIENTNIENIEHSVKTNFNWVTMPVGLFGSSKSSDYVNKRVVFKMEFHDFGFCDSRTLSQWLNECDCRIWMILGSIIL